MATKTNETSEKKVKFIVILCAFLILVIAFLVYALLTKNTVQENTGNKNLVIDTSAETIQKGKTALTNRQVYFYGIVDGTMSVDSPILLQNPKDNEDILIKYTVINDETGETVYETDLVEAGKSISWYPGEKLTAGVYNFTVIEEPYYQVEGSEGYLPLTVGNNHITIELIN